MLAFTRIVLKLRKDHAALRAGGIAFLETPETTLAFTRGEGADQVLCLFNLSAAPASFTPPGAWTPILASQSDATTLSGYAGVWLKPKL